MKPYNHNLTFKQHKLFGALILLAATSSLFACSETNTTAATTTPVERVTDSQNSQFQTPQVNATSITDTSSLNSEALKNVSATVYKDANCGCCKEWIHHAEHHGMSAAGQDVADLAVFKERYGVPSNMRSCHTAVTTDGYVFEGHVPAKYIAQFLANPPSEAIGLAVPGMPVGSPGMEYQNKFSSYQVMQINKDGSTAVYAEIDSPKAQL
ncbi:MULTISPECIES: DUF411 domain-containing protein [unclassified Psychrobacter]|uniref:DUF411 domain-containing protein n=1 Tax=unclassified Psychrobacter TaxID=196806 RepID=UPI0025F95A93|nr:MULTISPECIES: DUF411 domain-containing protein [unclassified Psychrobacter]